MTTVLLRKDGDSLAADDKAAAELVAKLKPGQVVRAEIRRLRHPAQHRYYWALVDICFQHQSRYATKEQLHNALKIGVGLYDEAVTPTGRSIAVARSIAFGNMRQEEFDDFLNSIIRLVCEVIIPGTKDEDLRQQLEEMVGGKT